MAATRKIVLELDPDDWDAVQTAFAERQSWQDEDNDPIRPETASNLSGELVSEICRGWMQMIGVW